MVSEKTALGQFGCFSRLHFVESKKQVPLVLPLLFFREKKTSGWRVEWGNVFSCWNVAGWRVSSCFPFQLETWRVSWRTFQWRAHHQTTKHTTAKFWPHTENQS